MSDEDRKCRITLCQSELLALWVRMNSKADQLRMFGVTFEFPLQHGFSQQPASYTATDPCAPKHLR